MADAFFLDIPSPITSGKQEEFSLLRPPHAHISHYSNLVPTKVPGAEEWISCIYDLLGLDSMNVNSANGGLRGVDMDEILDFMEGALTRNLRQPSH